MLSILYQNHAFLLGEADGDAVLRFLPASCEIGGAETVGRATVSGNTVVTDLGALTVTDTVTPEKDGLFRIERTVKNTGVDAVTFKDIFAVETGFVPARYTVPCVNYNGNEGCRENTPIGLCRDGKPWVYAYDREGIPSCTLCEDRHFGTAIFASDRDAASLRSSCSLEKKADGRFVQKIYHPVTEAPYTYSSKNILTERYDESMTLAAGESFSAEMYVFACVPKYENYAMANLLDCAADVFDLSAKPWLTPDEVWKLGIAYANALLYDYKGHTMIVTHFAPRLFRAQHGAAITGAKMAELMKDPYYAELGRFDERFEMGWADQGLLNARMLAADALERGDKVQLGTAIGIFADFAATQKENGLLYSQYQQNFETETYDFATPDVCNFGWGAAEFSRMYTLLKRAGIDKPEFLRFSEKLCDFFCAHFSEEYGFGKSWTLDGECVMQNGSIGGFMITGLTETYRASGNAKYLETAKKASDFYFARDLDRFVCSAGALDCQSIDKETAYPFITSSLMLFEDTGDKKYLTRAEKAAYYFFSWAYHYDVLYPAGSEFTEYGYHTKGGTAVSTEHHCIDAWGAAAVTDFFALAKYTGDERWRKRARAMWANAVQGITASDTQKIHGVVRPLGSQNEGFFQARWTKYRPTCEERGHFNDCLCAWSGAYRMMALHAQKCVDAAKDASMKR